MTALPYAMRELAKFFLNLSGSSSLGATGDLAGVTASAAASGGIACPSSTAAVAATICAAAVTPAGDGVLPAAPAAVPSVSGEQQRQVESLSRGRRSRSSGERTDRRAKKRSRRRSPSSERSSRRREKRYRSSLDSSEEERADASPPRSRHAHGGARTGGSYRDFDCSPRPGTSRSSAREEHYRSGASRRSPVPSGGADDDRSSSFESVDFARDDSFRAVLGLIREFHDMAEPATVPAARCKTSLAPAYGLMSESSPAFTLPVSPCYRHSCWTLTRTCPSFWRTRPCTGSFPCLVAVIGGTTAPPPPLFLGRTPSHQALPPLPWRKPVRLRSVPFFCLPHRSPRWRPCFLVCARSLPGWTGGCRPAVASGIICRSKFVLTSRGS